MFDGTSGDEIRGFRGATPLEPPGGALCSSLQERDLRPIPGALITVASPACLLGGSPFGLRLTGPFTCPLPASFPPAGSSLKADWQATSPDHSPFMVGARIPAGSGGVNIGPNAATGLRAPKAACVGIRGGPGTTARAAVAPAVRREEGTKPMFPLPLPDRCRAGPGIPVPAPRPVRCRAITAVDSRPVIGLSDPFHGGFAKAPTAARDRQAPDSRVPSMHGAHEADWGIQTKM